MGKISQGLLILFLLIGLIFITPLVRPVEAQIHTEECAPTYAVRAGDTIQFIAQRCGVSEEELRNANPQINDPNQISPGQVLIIPGILPIAVSESIPETASIASTSSGTFTVTQPAADANIVQPEPALQVPTSGFETDWPVHTVSGGETLFRIAERYGTSVSAILQINSHIGNPNLIFPGQTVRIPVTTSIPITGPGVPIPTTGGITHVVRSGDTLSRIAAQFGTTVPAVLQLNPQIVNPNILEAGTTIRVG